MTHTYSVLGMDCEDCAKKIKNFLSKIKGIKSVQIDVPSNVAIVQMETHIGVDELNDALKGSEYMLRDERMVQTGGITQKSPFLSKFWPLILIFSFIYTLTILAVSVSGEFDWVYAMRMFEGFFFIIFGGFKMINWAGFVNAYQTYDIIARYSRTYAYAYPLIELGLGVGYLTGFNLTLVNWITIFVMGISAVGVLQALMNKKEVQCACLGVVFRVPMTKVTLLEDILMIVMASAMLLIG